MCLSHDRIAGLCKDYCGVLNEEAIRLNFVLIYELLDEVLVSLLVDTPSHCHTIIPPPPHRILAILKGRLQSP